MDLLARLLDGPRGRDAYLLRASFAPPWSLQLADEAPLGLVAVLHGSVYARGGGVDVELGAGDTLVSRGPESCTLSDRPGAPPEASLLPGMRCKTPDGQDVTEQLTLGLRSWGNDPEGSTVMLLGCYQLRGAVSQRLLAGLPHVLHLRADELQTPLVAILAEEIVKDEPGQAAVLDRLFDLLLVALLRSWHTREHDGRPGWLSAQSDPVVGPALGLIHDNPAHPWTIAELAARVGCSRATLARRFGEVVGEPPMTYLTGWRLALAADLLLEPESTIEAVAREVGYSTAFALSAAFKRERGISPKEHREHALVSSGVR